MRTKIIALLCAVLMLLGTPVIAVAQTSDNSDVALVTQTSSKAQKNRKAHTAYYKKLKALRRKGKVLQGTSTYCFTDITGDGVDEMIVRWWPSVYTYRGGKVVCVHDGELGSSSYGLYKGKKVFSHFIPDHMGSGQRDYYKWNGGKFVKVATMYQPSAYRAQQGAKSYYWVKGKGKVSKKRAKAYVKKLVKGAKSIAPAYVTY